ncbi:MAG TPA: FtsQ-type POTRA domain-containing protein [Clostridiales bacterium]|nr:FtsQ-type POTRA domain-containing protein [Clostridiales bacterium]
MAGSGSPGRKRKANVSLREKSMKRREKKKQTGSVAGFLIRTGVVVSLFVIAYFLLLNSSFKVEEFEIEGNSKVSDADIITLSGIHIGDDLFQSNVSAAADQIGLHVLIEDVKVRVRPFHKILIEITEKDAVAGFVDDDTYYYIDANKVVVGESEMVDDSLPLFSGFEIPSFISIGLQMNNAELNTDLTIAEEAASLFSGYTLEISAQSESVNNIYLNGVEVRLGTTGRLEQKLTVLATLVSSMSQQKLESLEYIDISIPDEPVVKEKPLNTDESGAAT